MSRWCVAFVVIALPSLAAAQAVGESPSQMILGTGVLPAGGPPWPGVGNAAASAPAAAVAPPTTAGAAPVAAPPTPLVVPNVAATTSSPAAIALPAPSVTPMVSSGVSTVTGIGSASATQPSPAQR